MSANLCPAIPTSFVDGESYLKFFTEEERGKTRTLELREVPLLGVAGESCKTNLFFGFFFDGTKNNYVQAEKGLNHSNVARLYDCYPGLSVPGVLPASTDWQYKPSSYTYFFKTYIPGLHSKDYATVSLALRVTHNAGLDTASKVAWCESCLADGQSLGELHLAARLPVWVAANSTEPEPQLTKET